MLSCNVYLEAHSNINLGTLRLSQQALQKHGPILCGYRPILRSNDFSSVAGTRIFPVADNMSLVSDFFHVDCRAKDNSSYSNYHMGLKFNPLLHSRYVCEPLILYVSILKL